MCTRVCNPEVHLTGPFKTHTSTLAKEWSNELNMSEGDDLFDSIFLADER